MEFYDLRKSYDVLVKKYKLPSFVEVDADFEIHKIDRESETLLRSVRKQMMEKIVNSVGFVEMLLSGMNAPRMYFTYIKTMPSEDRKAMEDIYREFSSLIISSLELEVDYSEANEAELVKKIMKTWEGARKGFKKVLHNIQKPSSSEKKKERSYFG